MEEKLIKILFALNLTNSMSKLLFFITNSWSNDQSKAKLYCFYDSKTAKEKLLEPGFITSITFAGSLMLEKSEGAICTDVTSNESYGIPYEEFNKVSGRNRYNCDYPHNMFNTEKFKDKKPFFWYGILSWCITNGEIHSNMDRHPYNSFHRALYEYFYNVKDNRIDGYEDLADEDPIKKWTKILAEVESRPEKNPYPKKERNYFHNY